MMRRIHQTRLDPAILRRDLVRRLQRLRRLVQEQKRRRHDDVHVPQLSRVQLLDQRLHRRARAVTLPISSHDEPSVPRVRRDASSPNSASSASNRLCSASSRVPRRSASRTSRFHRSRSRASSCRASRSRASARIASRRFAL